MGLAALTAGIGFLLHELAHKKVALKYRCHAEFKSFDFMLLLAIGMSFFGFLLVAPGGVFIRRDHKRISKRENGWISLAGPLTNIALALVFLLLLFVFKEGFINNMANYGFEINAWLAFFNMLPFSILDGKKVFDWDKKVGFLMLIGSLTLLIVTGFV